MHADDLASAPADTAADGRPWYTGLTRYQWFVFVVAALGWLFDCMDQRIFMVSRQPAMTELLGYKYEEGKLVTLAGESLTPSEATAATEDRDFYSGLATAVFMIGWATGGLFFGMMGDRWGRARTMLLTILIYSLFTGLTALSQYWWDFMAYRFITGMGVGGEFAAGVSLLAEVMPARARPYALGLLQALSAFGNITGSLLSWGFGWRALFVVGIIPSLLVVLVRRNLKEPDSWLKARKEAEERKAAAEAAALAGGGTGANGGDSAKEMGSLGSMLSNPRWRYHTIIGVLLALSGVIGLWGIAFWTFELVADVLRTQVDADGRQLYTAADITRIRAWGTALQDVGAFFGIYVFSIVAGRIGRRWAFAGAFVLALGATVFVFGTLSSESDVYWMLPLLGFCSLMVFGGYAIYFPELYPTRLRSTGTGFCYNVARYVASMGPFLLPVIIMQYRSSLGTDAGDPTPFRYATITLASIYLLGLAVLPFAPETKGKPLPE